MDRQDFMDIVYAELADDPDNNRANRIIWAADGYATAKNVGSKISKEPLELARAIDGLTEWQKHVQTDSNISRNISVAIEALKAQLGTDCISRQAIDKFIDGLEEIFADLRERHIDDSVCGLCEYDGAYIGQSGDWCNECPGFEKDDCFKLSDKTRKEWTEEIIKALPPSQPEPCEDAVSREEVLNCLEWQYPDKTPRTKIMELPSVTPKQRTGKWIRLDMHAHLADHKCTACGQVCYVPTCMGEPLYAFCPNCGAKMMPSNAK